jgi:hypothetical protein
MCAKTGWVNTKFKVNHPLNHSFAQYSEQFMKSEHWLGQYEGNGVNRVNRVFLSKIAHLQGWLTALIVYKLLTTLCIHADARFSSVIGEPRLSEWPPVMPGPVALGSLPRRGSCG